MERKGQPPWASGPGEILRHGLEVLKTDSDSNRRLAMICIDNAVELMIKTFLGLPSRITGLRISRKEYEDFSESFPKLLDALQTYASQAVREIDLGEIEWYHRLRNELYHQGNGLTVERDKVEVYAELANVLFENLFGVRLTEPEDEGKRLLGEFINAWFLFEAAVSRAEGVRLKDISPRWPLDVFGQHGISQKTIKFLHAEGVLSSAEATEIDELRNIRNLVMHSGVSYRTILKPAIVERLRQLASKIERYAGDKGKPEPARR